MDDEGKTKKRGTAENDPLASAIGGEYEVFLSFRGQDTRKIFTDFLYKDLDEKGIHTFRDNDKLHVGEKIGPELQKAIKESKISIPIFSKNYASSKWCLRELAQMVVCQKTMRQKILPIFYDVKPYDVRHQTGSYEEAFRQHEEGFDEKTVQEWREALREVGQLKGWELEKETDGYEGKLVKVVVEEVLSQLKKNYMVVTDNLVGIDHHIEEMKRLLNVGSNDVWIVGIYGMGGIGKTTIAKVVYNKLLERFDCYCFLKDVREMAQRESDLVNLQKQLISKIRKVKVPDIANVDEGINMIQDMARNKKVLIVLDDVDDPSQFDKLVGKHNRFGSGSRIIVTTRNKAVLDRIKVDDRIGVDEAYEPQPMELDDALQLFSKHAFWSDSPPEDLRFRSEQVVSTTGRLPLALESIGSLLFGECEEKWGDILEKLRNIPHDKIEKNLRISYDALEDEEKQIFLDIACFFIGENKTFPFYMWKDCKYFPGMGIESLVLKSLVKIGDDNKFIMHNQLRDLGRHIVRQENMDDPMERSRLWFDKEAWKILGGRMGAENVKALCLQECSEVHPFTNDEVGKLPNLRFFRVNRTILNGDFNNLLSKLIWLQWRMCTDNSRPTNFHLKNLVILDLSYSCCITKNWEGWSQIKMAKKLKVLDLSHCEGLTITPDLSDLVMLKGLGLSRCDKLVEVRGLTGLKSLETLNMRRCENLPGIRGLEELESLEILDISGCRLLGKSLDLSNLQKLKKLKACGCEKLLEIRGLEELESLEILDTSGCRLLEKSLDLSNLQKLKELKADGCENLLEIRGLEELQSLEILDISYCRLLDKSLDLSNLKKLEELRAVGCENLPEIRGLKELGILKIFAGN